MITRLVEREAQIGALRADILAIDDRGRKVIIENQFGPTDHMRFGQIVLYGLEACAPASPTRWLRLSGPWSCHRQLYQLYPEDPGYEERHHEDGDGAERSSHNREPTVCPDEQDENSAHLTEEGQHAGQCGHDDGNVKLARVPALQLLSTKSFFSLRDHLPDADERSR
jgi:hypothetical protein